MLRLSKNNISKFFFTILLLIFWGRDHLISYAKTFLLKLPYVYLIADYIIPCAMALCFFAALPFMAKAISYKDILFMLVVGLAYCLNLLIYKDTRNYLTELGWTFWISIFPVYFIGVGMDSEDSLPFLYKLSILNIWLLMIITLLFGTPMSEERSLYQGAMGRAYNLLPHIMMVCIYVLDRPNVVNVSTFALSSVYLLTCGTRGAVLCLFSFIVLFVLLQKPIRKNIAMYIAMLFVMILILRFYREILLGMRVLAREIGMSERIINKLLSGSFFVSSGRNTLRSTVVNGIFENPVLGYGIAGDRALIGIYVHNLLLEMLVSFGVILGAMLFVSLVILLVMGYRRASSKQAQKLILLLFCTVIIKLFMSSTYLEEELFFLLLGICVNQIRNGSDSRGIEKLEPMTPEK